ncbi:MAG TPA: hypothetical protein VN397_01625, partial [Candidatus Methylomirabilis sp.]|nr:hypothetical protein [Candidatus Methylomirabilis sp.]
MGFGKLPSLTPPNVSQPTEPPASSVARTPMATGETEGISADSKAMAAPATAPSASPSSIVRPIPPPPPKPRPLTV